MDPTKSSLTSKAANVNNGVRHEANIGETAEHCRDGREVERQKDVEIKETEVVDGIPSAAETLLHHRGSADKNKFHTMGFQRRTMQKVVTDFATMGKASVKSRTALRQVLFSQDKNPTPETQGQLEELKQVLEAYMVPESLKWRWGEDGEGTTLERNWTDLVHSHSSMSKTQRHQQEALWEFVYTELTYINKLTIIKDLVIAALDRLHQHGFLLEVIPELLFSNLPSILNDHRLFWQEVIYPMLQEVRRTGKPFDPVRLEAGCMQFKERFSSYLPYCWQEETTLEFTRRQMDTSPHFIAYLQWVETHPQCERMRLGDMQAKPHQRITKYPLLLKAVLSSTEDPDVQCTLRGMDCLSENLLDWHFRDGSCQLSRVNDFLDSINDYLRLQDEELALSISAKRVEGYEVQGINDEIDKYVRELCHFDLTCPIKGVGSGVIRKLLLEENLKVRGRKDSKLEVVALLFSDVLLMTKVQKKAERLKVVRPPLALDRTCCAVLKDAYSFILVEVGELGSAANVYIFATATPERCSTWVSTIQQAQEKLKDMRETESNRQMDSQRRQHCEAKPITVNTMVNNGRIKPHSIEDVGKLNDEATIPQSVNGNLTSNIIETHPHQQRSNREANYCLDLPCRPNMFRDNHNKSVHGGFAGRTQVIKGKECTGMWMRARNKMEEEAFVVPSLGLTERRVTWNQNRHSAPDLGEVLPHRSQPIGHNRPHSLLIDGYPAVDYPTTQPDTSPVLYREQKPTDPMGWSQSQGFPVAGGRSISKDSDSQSPDQGRSQDSWKSLSGEDKASELSEAWRFSRNLKSPSLRRRRALNSHQNACAHMATQSYLGSDWSAPNTSSSSNSDYDSNQKLKLASSGHSSDSHRVLKLRSLKLNQSSFWPEDRASPDPETFSEPELPQENHNLHKKRTQRSASIPDIKGRHGLHLNSLTLPRIEAVLTTKQGPQVTQSHLEGILERAKGRDNHGALNPPSSPSFSSTPSPAPSEGDRETEWKEVELMRHRAPRVSEGWREQLVDGDEDERRSSPVIVDGVNVDWPGWCVDDDEVIDFMSPVDYSTGNEGLLEDIRKTLILRNFQGISEQEEEEISHV